MLGFVDCIIVGCNLNFLGFLCDFFSRVSRTEISDVNSPVLQIAMV